MNKYKLTSLLPLLTLKVICGFIIVSCNNYDERVSTNAKIIDAPMKQQIRTDVLDLNQLYKEVKIVVLGGSEGRELIGAIRDIKTVDNYLFINDGNAIHLYDMDGFPLSVIDRRGRGHGEYLTLSCFDIDKESKRIIIYDSTKRKMLYYSYDGFFLKEIDCNEGFLISDFEVINKGEYIFYYSQYDDIGPKGLWLADSNCVYKKQLINYDESCTLSYTKENYLVQINDHSIGFMGGEGNNIFYSINGDSVEETYQVRSDIRIPQRLLRKEKLSDRQRMKLFIKDGYFETENTLFFDMINGEGNGYTIIYDKFSDRMYRIYDDNDIVVTGDANIVPHFQFCDCGKLIGFYTSSTIMKYEILKERFPEINENSNPVVFLVSTQPVE